MLVFTATDLLSITLRRGVNAVTGNLAVGLAAGLATGGLLGPARKTIKCGGCGTKACKVDRPRSPVQPRTAKSDPAT